MRKFDYDMLGLMDSVKRVIMADNQKNIAILENAMRTETELTIKQLDKMFSYCYEGSYRLAHNDCGVTLYVLAPDNSWVFGAELICADEDYNKFMVDSIIYPCA